MPDGVRQLALDLRHEPRFGEEDFLVSPSNEAAYAAIGRGPTRSDPLLRLEGPRGSGKSHLASIWAGRTGAALLPARSVSAATVPLLASAPALALEDLDAGPLDEDALFHLVNLAREGGLPLLLTSGRPVELCGIGTPDLLSRLRLATAVRLGEPDDGLLKAVLVKLFADRQLGVDASVVEFVALRIERSLARAAEVVAELDREALSQGRRVTRLIAAAVLGRHPDAME